MKSIFLSVLYFMTIGSSLAFTTLSSNGPGPKDSGTNVVNKALLLELVNKARKKGCQCGDTYFGSAPALTWNDQLEKAAFDHSADMSGKKYFSHTSPNGDKAGERIRKAGYNWLMYGENIGMGFKNETEAIESWLHSPGHCKNIMNKNYKEMAVARVGNYWTQTFGVK
jgi:uncharacterized protein YkwD